MLSGGERNRLLLARLFAKPSNLLVMDEPTNDLDVETLDLLEELVANYSGTLLLVSHDRAFIDNVVTSTLVFEGEGRLNEYVGGYSDWLRQRRVPPGKSKVPAAPASVAAEPVTAARAATAVPTPAPVKPRKRSHKDQRELDAIPQIIARLESEQSDLAAAIGDPEWFRRSPEDATAAVRRLESVERELETVYARWEALEAPAKE
jgi:ATP-binding cassette subfamily F protein uup